MTLCVVVGSSAWSLQAVSGRPVQFLGLIYSRRMRMDPLRWPNLTTRRRPLITLNPLGTTGPVWSHWPNPQPGVRSERKTLFMRDTSCHLGVAIKQLLILSNKSRKIAIMCYCVITIGWDGSAVVMSGSC